MPSVGGGGCSLRVGGAARWVRALVSGSPEPPTSLSPGGWGRRGRAAAAARVSHEGSGNDAPGTEGAERRLLPLQATPPRAPTRAVGAGVSAGTRPARRPRQEGRGWERGTLLPSPAHNRDRCRRKRFVCSWTRTGADVPLPRLIPQPLIRFLTLIANSFLAKKHSFFFFFFSPSPPLLPKVQFMINLECPARMSQLVCDLHSMAVRGANRPAAMLLISCY